MLFTIVLLFFVYVFHSHAISPQGKGEAAKAICKEMENENAKKCAHNTENEMK